MGVQFCGRIAHCSFYRSETGHVCLLLSIAHCFSLQIGKFGITANVEISLSDALEKNELIKVRHPWKESGLS